MYNKFLWHNFRDARRPDLIDQRLEEKAQQVGASYPSSPMPSAGAIRRSHEAASGGKKDRCQKGTSCGAACIHANDKCLQEFPLAVSSAVRSVSKVLSDRLEEGSISEEEAEKVISELKGLSKSQIKAYSDFKDLMDSGKISEAEKEQVANLIVSTIMVTGQDKKAVRAMSFDEIEAALKPGRLEALEKAYNNSFTPEGKFDPSRPGAMGDLVQKALVNEISNEVAEVAYNMLSSTARSKLNRMGNPPAGRTYGGDDENGNPLFVESSNSNRGIFMAKRFMEQGGIDPYTGKRLNILSSEAEHMVASSHVKEGAGSADQPRNLLWAAPTGNNSKAASKDNFRQWREALLEIQRGGREKYEKGKYGEALAEAEASKGRKAQAPTELARALSQSTPEERISAIKALTKAYGDEVRYLLRAAGMQSGEWNMYFPDKKGRPSRKQLDLLASLKINGVAVKPSLAVLMASSVLEPSQRSSFLRKVDSIRMARQMSPEEVEQYNGRNDPRYISRKAELDRKFEDDLSSLIQSVAPEIGNFL